MVSESLYLYFLIVKLEKGIFSDMLLVSFAYGYHMPHSSIEEKFTIVTFLLRFVICRNALVSLLFYVKMKTVVTMYKLIFTIQNYPF